MPKNVPIEFERKVQITDEALALMNAGDTEWDTKIHAKYQIPRAQLVTILGDRRNGRGRFSRLDHFHRDKPTATPIPKRDDSALAPATSQQLSPYASHSTHNAPNLAQSVTDPANPALTPAPARDPKGHFAAGSWTPPSIGGRTKAEVWALRELAGVTGLAVRTQTRIIEMVSAYVERIFNEGRFTFDLEEAKNSEGELVYVDMLLLEKLYALNEKLLNRVSGTPPKRLIVEMNKEEDEGDARLQQAVEKMPEELRRTLADSLAPIKIV